MKIYAKYLFASYGDLIKALAMLGPEGQCIMSHGIDDDQIEGYSIEDGIIKIEVLRNQFLAGGGWADYVGLHWEREAPELAAKDPDYWISPFVFEDIMTYNKIGIHFNGEAYDWGVVDEPR